MSLVHMVMSSLSEQIWKLNSLESLKNDVMKSAAVEHAFAAVDHNGLSACTYGIFTQRFIRLRVSLSIRLTNFRVAVVFVNLQIKFFRFCNVR